MAYINKCSHSRPVFLFTSIYHHKSDLGKTWNGLTYCWVVFILAKWRMWEQKQYNFKERTRESPEYTDKQPLCWQMVVMNSEALEFVISLSISKRNECHHKQLSTPSPISSGLSCMMFHWTTQHSYTNKVSECLVRGWLHNIQGMASQYSKQNPTFLIRAASAAWGLMHQWLSQCPPCQLNSRLWSVGYLWHFHLFRCSLI